MKLWWRKIRRRSWTKGDGSSASSRASVAEIVLDAYAGSAMVTIPSAHADARIQVGVQEIRRQRQYDVERCKDEDDGLYDRQICA